MKQQILILGGGFAGLRALYGLSEQLEDRVNLTLIDPRSTSLAKPSLPEVALAGKPITHTQIPLKPLVERKGGRFVQAEVEMIEPTANQVVLKDGSAFPYDYLLVTVGALKDYDAISGYRAHGYSICDDVEAPKTWEAVTHFAGGPIVVGAARSVWGSRVVVPALSAPCEGPIGEVIFMLDHYLREKKRRDVSPITAFSPGANFFEDVGKNVHAVIEPLLGKHAIQVETSKVLSKIAEDHVEFADGSSLESMMTIIIPPYTGNPLIKRSGIGDEQGFVPTDGAMRHLDYANIFAAGDGAALSMPKLGHIAIMQADVATASLVREITGKGEILLLKPEIFCIMNQGGAHATLILSDTLYGGTIDFTLSGSAAHFMKWSFDSYYFYTHGHIPPNLAQDALEGLLHGFAKRLHAS